MTLKEIKEEAMKQFAIIINKKLYVKFFENKQQALDWAESMPKEGFVFIEEVESVHDDTQVHGYRIQDIIERAEDTQEIKLTEEQAIETLGFLDRIADCSQGVSWYEIDLAIERFISRNIT